MNRLLPPARRGGYTLYEVVTSMSVLALLMGGMVSAVVIAGRTVDDGGLAQEALTSVTTLGDLAGELGYATAVTQRTATSVDFTMLDRRLSAAAVAGGATPAPVTIRYSWSGTPGDPLTRSLNGGPARTVADDVREFSLAYDLKTVQRQTPTQVESGEVELFKLDAGSDMDDDDKLESGDGLCQVFEPNLPADALGWKVTRVRLRLRQHGDVNGSAAVQLRLPDHNNSPLATVLGEVTFAESSLTGSYQWKDFAFNVGGLSPSRGVCVVVKHVSGSHPCDVYVWDDPPMPPTTKMLRSSGGTTWSIDNNDALRFYAYGTITTPGTPTTTTVNFLDRVAVRLRTGRHAASVVSTAVHVANEPQVSP